MAYVLAKLTDTASSDLHRRIGDHSRPYWGLVGWDAATGQVIAPDGPRRNAAESDLILAALHEWAKSGIRVTFNDGRTVYCARPYWLK